MGLFSQFRLGAAVALLQSLWRIEIVVVDHDVGLLGGRAFPEIALLPAIITTAVWRVGIERLRRSVAHGVACAGDREIDMEEDREIPAFAQFGTMQEDAVDDQRGCGRRLLRLRRDEPVGAVVEIFRDVAARAYRT